MLKSAVRPVLNESDSSTKRFMRENVFNLVNENIEINILRVCTVPDKPKGFTWIYTNLCEFVWIYIYL